MAREASRPRAAEILRSARAIENPDERFTHLAQALEDLTAAGLLAEPLLDALRSSSLDDEQVGARVVQLCRARAKDVDFLAAMGSELEHSYFAEEAIEVLQLARAAGSTNPIAMTILGRLLCLRGDPSGVAMLEQVIAGEPTWAPPRIALAMWHVTGDPTRALAVLDEAADDNTDDELFLDARSLVLARLGRDAEAARTLGDAIELAEHPRDAHLRLAEWHYHEHRYDRALLHARALLAERRTLTAAQLDDEQIEVEELECAILQAYRLAGAFEELVPWLAERCADAVPARLAFDIYFGLTSREPIALPALAIRAAQAAANESRAGHHVWQIREAIVRARGGDRGPLDQLAQARHGHAPAWLELADAYVELGDLDAATAALDHATALAPDAPGVLNTTFDIALEHGDTDTMRRAIERFSKRRPLAHEGAEHAARYHARTGDVAAALEHAARAVAIAPYCQNAWLARAEACAVAGDLAAARTALARSTALVAPIDGDHAAILGCALAGDVDGLERALAVHPRGAFPAFDQRLRELARHANS
ncbi:MAG TPA: hypothetical protein VFQ53_21600 [Kofleriaceae bacterium]|nr:hypothetical protein [Kofleriaceae bacterium]